MNFDEYQARTADTAIYPGQGTVMGLLYCALGLGEAGEVQGKIKKILRDNNGAITEETEKAVEKELGDLLWYAARVADELDLSLDHIAASNLAKLADRKERGVLQGNGDDR
jgi:NTP pyrophosphatase (non-canonical NTP hydrolase)